MRTIIKLLAAIVAVPIIALLVIEYTQNNYLRSPIAWATERWVGRRVEINGDLKVHVLTLTPRALAEDITYANAPWASKEPMVEARHAEVAILLPALLHGRVELTKIELREAHARLATRKDGPGNWTDQKPEDPQEAAPPDAPPAERLPLIENVVVHDARITFTSDGGMPVDVLADELRFAMRPGTGLDLDLEVDRLRVPRRAREMTLARSLKLRSHLEGRNASLDVTIEALSLGGISAAFLSDLDAGRVHGEELADGLVALAAKLRSSGDSWDEITKNLDGEISVALEDGHVHGLIVEALGLDVTESVGVYFAKSPKVAVQCVLAQIVIERGLAKFRPLVMESTDSNILGSGTVDLDARRLDLKFQVEPKDLSLGTLRSPIAVQGALTNPQILPEPRPIAARAAAAVGLGVLLGPAAALLPFIEVGLGKDGKCAAYASKIAKVQARAAR